MKEIIMPLCALLAFALPSCSSPKTEQAETNEKAAAMEKSINDALIGAFNAQNLFEASSLTVEIYDIVTGDEPFLKIDEPGGKFCCMFSDDGHNVRVIGSVGFDRDGNISLINGLPDIKAKYIAVDTLTDDVATSKYNLWKMPQDSLVEQPGAVQDDNINHIILAQHKAVSQLKSWGAKDAYISSDKYLVYVVDEASLAATPNEVARSMYELFSDVPGIVGVRVVSASSKRKLGES